mmetsp:Transcript_5456/g.6203  ORF Transcript_5456/g.6203 Transcript_5456/m.6203 type:complete len:242 (-) Transcript_5456:5-730(-)
MGVIFVNTVIVSLHLVSPYALLMDFGLFFKSFHIWRVVTCYTFVGGFSFNFLMMLMLANFSVGSLEKLYAKNIHAFYYLISFTIVSHLLLGFLLDSYQVLTQEFLFTMLYIFCKREPENIVNFWGFAIKTGNFPWVLLGFSLLIGNDIFKILAGYAIGHLYMYLKYILPDHYGYKLMETPLWFKKVVNWVAGKIAGYQAVRPQRQWNNVRDLNNQDPAEEFNNAQGGFAAFGGRGVRLGGE